MVLPATPSIVVCSWWLLSEHGPTGGWEEGGREGICVFTSTQKYFLHFQNGAFHLLNSKQLGKKHYLSHPVDKVLECEQGHVASQNH